MTHLAYITTCKGRLDHLKQTIPRVAAQSELSAIVVDYDCPDRAGDWITAHFPTVKIVRVTQAPIFNVARARNLGAAAAMDAEWLAFFDADTLVSPEFAATVLPTLAAGSFYVARPTSHDTTGLVICRRSDFIKVGGYDEAISGFGGEDNDLYDRLVLAGNIKAAFAAELVDAITHDDALRVRHYSDKDIDVSIRINKIYRSIKLDLIKLLGENLDLRQRQALHDKVALTYRTMSGPMARVDINLPEIQLRGRTIDIDIKPSPLNRILSYRFEPTIRRQTPDLK